MKRVLPLVALLAILLFLAGGAGFWFVNGLARPAYLVSQIENTFNCRAQINQARLQLFQSPARLEIRGLALAPRDDSANNQTPLAQRPPIQPTTTVDYILLELKTAPLLQRKLVITKLTIERPRIDMTVYEDGHTTFDEMIKPAPAASAAPGGQRDGGSKPEDDHVAVTVDQLPIEAIEGRVAVEDATINATIERSKTTVQIHKGILIFSDVDINPTNLEGHNAANIDLSAWIGVDSFEKNTRYMDLWLDGTGAVQPFDPKSGELDPSLSAQVTVRKDSWIDAFPAIDDMENLLKELKQYGVDFEGVRLRGDFSEDTSASFNATRKSVKMTSDFMIPVDENFVVIENGSWINSATNDHEFALTFIGSERLTRKMESEMSKYLGQKLGETEASVVKAAVLSFVKQSEFLVLRFTSKGDLGKPSVAFVTPVGDIGSLMKKSDETMNALKSKAQDLLKDLFGSGKGSDGSAPQTPPGSGGASGNP